MSFLHPAFLWALTALAIPVLIHLFQLRRFKRIDFPNIRFLAEVTQQTRARKKVRHWLVLISRCLAIAALVLAFAQPYLPGNNGQVKAGPRAVSLYIDDSYSMDGQNAGGRLLDQARKGAQETVMAYGATDRFQVLTGRFEGKQQMLVGRDEALQAAAQVDVSAFTRPVSKVLARQRAALAAADAITKRAVLFTDLQRTITDVEAWTNDTTVPTLIVPLPPSQRDNLSIDSAWFASPVRRAGQPEVLHVTITNHGGQDLVNVPLRLSVDGGQRALATFSVIAGATVDTTLQFLGDNAGDHWGEIAITDQPVTFDDRMYIAYRVIDRTRVLLLSGGDAEGDRAVQAVFGNDSAHTFTTKPYREVDLAELSQQDLVVLNALPEVPTGVGDALVAFMNAGGSVVCFPPSQGDAQRYATFFAQVGAAAPTRMDTAQVRVERIDLEQPFYRDIFQTMPRNVDLPTLRERWNVRPAAGSDALLRMQDGSVFLARSNVGRGSVYLCAGPLAERSGDLLRHALFATSLLRMAELARPMGRLYHTIGADALIPLEGLELSGEAAPHLRGPDGFDVVPEVRRVPGSTNLALHDEDLPAGPYALTMGGDTLLMLALDLARRESDLTAWTPAELTTALEERGLTSFMVMDGNAGDLSLRLVELDQGRKLWKWFILLALLFLAAETILIRTLR